MIGTPTESLVKNVDFFGKFALKVSSVLQNNAKNSINPLGFAGMLIRGLVGKTK